jgi:hypothetical protein
MLEARFMNVRVSEETAMTVAGLDVCELIEWALLLVAVGALSGFLAGSAAAASPGSRR